MTANMDITVSELPDWMRRARRGIDWGALLVIAFSLIAAWPFIVSPTLPRTNSSEHYVYRTADYADSIREGRLYPRWSPHALDGYGAPIPHYYPPGAVYGAAILDVLFTDNPVSAVRLVFCFAYALAGLFVYLLVTRRTEGASGILAAFLYLYSPYVGLVVPHILGDLSIMAGLALMPALVWSADRMLVRQRPADLVMVTALTAGLFLTDLRLAVTTLTLLAGLSAWHSINTRKPSLSVWIGCGLGIGLSGFYWIPALLEHDEVRWDAPFVNSSSTVTLSKLLSALTQIDPGELVPSPQFSLGLAAILLVLLGGTAIFRMRRHTGFEAFFLFAGIALTGFMLTVSPEQPFLLGPIALCLSIGSSGAAQLRAALPRRWARLLLPILLIVIWTINSPVWLFRPAQEAFGSTDPISQIQYEQLGYGIAVLPPDQPVPTTLEESLPANRTLIESYLAGAVNKIAPGQLTPNAQIGILEHGTHSDRFQIRTNTPLTLNILTAHFPGWRAMLDNQITPLSRAPDTGLIRIDLPITRGSELFMTLGSTPVRSGAWIIAGISLLIALLLTRVRRRRWREDVEEGKLLTQAEIRLLAVLPISFALVIAVNAGEVLPVSLRARPGFQLIDSVSFQARSDGGISLLSYRLNTTVLQAGDHLELTLYWQAQRFLEKNYRAQIYLLNLSDGTRWNETDLHHPGGYPTRRWVTGRYVRDHYDFLIASNMPSGDYSISLEMFGCEPECSPTSRITFFDPSGRALGPVLALPTTIRIQH